MAPEIVVTESGIDKEWQKRTDSQLLAEKVKALEKENEALRERVERLEALRRVDKKAKMRLYGALLKREQKKASLIGRIAAMVVG